MSAATSNQVQEHMPVVCSLGMHVGTVDHVDGDRIKLTRNDSEDGKHHFVSMSLVDSVDEVVHLNRPCNEIKQTWQSE